MNAAGVARYYRDHPGLVGYHEAGHAVVARRLGWRILTVGAGRVGDSGETELEGDDDPAARLLVYLAGERAERRCRSWQPELGTMHGDHDRVEVRRAQRSLGLRTLTGAEEIVDRWLYEDRRGLDRLAGALVDWYEVDGRQAVALLAG